MNFGSAFDRRFLLADWRHVWMDKAELETYLQALASGQKSSNTLLVEAYLKDDSARPVARLLTETLRLQGKTLLLPPSHCLVLLD